MAEVSLSFYYPLWCCCHLTKRNCHWRRRERLFWNSFVPWWRSCHSWSSDELKLYDPAFGSPCSLNTAPPCGIGHQRVSRKSSHLKVGPAAYHLLHHTPPAPSWQPLITTRPFLEKLHRFVTQVVTPPTSSMFHSGFTSQPDCHPLASGFYIRFDLMTYWLY